jgi:transposase
MRGSRDDITDVITDNSKPDRTRRGEVLVGLERRRRWSMTEKLSIVAESFEPGAIVSHVAHRHGIRPQQLFDWRRQVRERVPGSLAAASSTPTEAPGFTPVVVAQQTSTPRVPAAASASLPSASIEIAIGAATVRVTGPVDAKALVVVLRAVKAAS